MDDWEDMARVSVESSGVDAAVGATSWDAVRETGPDGDARAKVGASVSADRNTADVVVSMTVTMVASTLDTPPPMVFEGEKRQCVDELKAYVKGSEVGRMKSGDWWQPSGDGLVG